jgi:hypothetical protein
MRKKGMELSALGWLIIGLIFLIIVLFVVFLSSGKLSGWADAIKSVVRFGG